MTKQKREPYGDGSFYQRSSDGRWFGAINAGYHPNGRRRRITVSAATEAEARRRLRNKKNEIARDGIPSTSTRTTVRTWTTVWLAQQQTKVTPNAYQDCATSVRRWIVPTIGHKRLDQLTPADIRAVTTAIRAAGRTSTTARGVHRKLMQLLRAAILEGHPVHPRLLLLPAPAASVSDRQALPVADAQAILRVAETLPHGIRWAFVVYYGLRQAECLGLTWDAIDVGQATAVIEWQLQPLPYRIPYKRASGFRVPDGYEARHLVDAWHLTRPKSKQGSRVIPLLPGIVDAFKAWGQVAPANPWGLVWPTTSGRPANTRQDLEEWHALQGTAGVGHPAGRYYHLHEARHTTATGLLETGADAHVITALLGHSSIVTSRGYMHVSQTAARAAMERVAARLELG